MAFNNIYKGKKVLVTGNTGFKGSWLSVWLNMLGAEIYGFSNEIPTKPSMFEVCNLTEKIHHEFGDIRDRDIMNAYIQEIKPIKSHLILLQLMLLVRLRFLKQYEILLGIVFAF